MIKDYYTRKFMWSEKGLGQKPRGVIDPKILDIICMKSEIQYTK